MPIASTSAAEAQYTKHYVPEGGGLPLTGLDAGLFLVLGVILVLGGNLLRRKNPA